MTQRPRTFDTESDNPADRLARELAAKGSVRSPQWRRAFAAVPRHLFVPAFHVRTPEGTVFYTDRRPGWLEAVYQDSTLITRFSSDGLAVSSSTEPSLMALMLESLDVEDGMKVLEIGTGTGYNAALLCERLGSGLVTSIDRTDTLVLTARSALAAAGYGPALAVADGAMGYAPNAPYDRILATCGLGRVPSAWLSQTAEAGMILANIGLGLVRLRMDGTGAAHGRFLPGTAGFMRLLSELAPAVPTPARVLSTTAEEPDRVRHFGPVPGLDDHAVSEFLLSLLLPSGLRVVQHGGQGDVHCVLDGSSGAWFRAKVAADGHVTVAERGPLPLWDVFLGLLDGWDQADHPGTGRYGLTVSPTGEHTLWIDQPDEHRVPLDRALRRTET